MVLRKVDNRLRVLIENGVATGHRTMFVIVGNKSRDQVVTLHHMLTKSSVRSRPSVLWCYKKELGFSSHRKKRMRQLQKKFKSGTVNVDKDDPFELFVSATNIRYCYYSETHKILGNTFGMCVLQDFEALTPNLLARTIETVEGGGIIAILLRSMTSLKQLYTMAMDVHARYRTESHMDVVGRFNERFILSVASCENCIVIDDQLNILPISTHSLNIKPEVRVGDKEKENVELKALKESLQDKQPLGALINCCKTLDQAKALLEFVDAISEKTLRSTVSLTAARGRGKSAALGLAITAAVAFRYANVFVTSPSPENLNTLFEFVFKGFEALDYQEHIDYDLVHSTNPEFNKAVICVNIFRDCRQTIKYIHPSDAARLGNAELVVIDEAAAIPLPLVKSLLGPYLVFMASTINGYEGTGRSLSLKLLQQLRQQTVSSGKAKKSAESIVAATGRSLHELSLNESIRYRPNDPVEKWLNTLLCLDATIPPKLTSQCAVSEDCDLYYINRDSLFCYHKASEVFLQRLMALYVASHYKNSPNDLQMLSDAPAHHLFCLLGPVDSTKSTLPDIFCVIQVCLEGKISRASITKGLQRGERASGDLIPWTLAQQFNETNFPSLSGARIVRIASHPDYQGMGYGSRALQLLQKYYSGLVPCVDEVQNETDFHEIRPVVEEEINILKEQIQPRAKLPPLFLKLSERPAERLDYVGVSFGLTADLLRFWKRSGFVPVYLRQIPNDLTGEHSCIMLKILNKIDEANQSEWLKKFWHVFRERFIRLLGHQFCKFHPIMVLSVLQNQACNIISTVMTKEELHHNFTSFDLEQLECYTKNMAEYRSLKNCLTTVAEMYFQQKLGDSYFTDVQCAVLAGLGLQGKSIDPLAKELEQPAKQLFGIIDRIIRQFAQHVISIDANAIADVAITESNIVTEPLEASVTEEMDEETKKIIKQKKKLKRLKALRMAKDSEMESKDESKTMFSDDSESVISGKSVSSKRKTVQNDKTEFSILIKRTKKKKTSSKQN